MAKRKIEQRVETFRKVTLNNKSRKGDYWYLKNKGERPKYFKVKSGQSRGELENWYYKGYRAGRGGVSKKKIQSIRSKEKQFSFSKSKRGLIEIDKALKEGYSEYTIQNGKGINPYTTKRAYINLLLNKDKVHSGLPIVRDSELRDILTTPEVVIKWKHRVLYEVTIYNGKGNRMGSIVTSPSIDSIKMLGEIKSEVVDKINIGMDVGQFSKAIKNMNLERNGYKFIDGTRDGKINSIKIKMVFRKGSR